LVKALRQTGVWVGLPDKLTFRDLQQAIDDECPLIAHVYLEDKDVTHWKVVIDELPVERENFHRPQTTNPFPRGRQVLSKSFLATILRLRIGSPLLAKNTRSGFRL